MKQTGPFRLLLFDIDGTLLDSGGAGTRSLNIAFREIFSVDNAFHGIKMAGKTDLQIIKEACALYNIPANNGFVPSVISRYITILKREISKGKKRLKPGVKDLLNELQKNSSCSLGLLTGNIEEGARIKLSALGIDHYFNTGAYGSDADDRDLLLPIAINKFRDISNMDISYPDCIVIGDTPRDVSCSKPYGAVSVAVSTGPYSSDDLRSAGADLVLDDLTDIKGFVRFCFQ